MSRSTISTFKLFEMFPDQETAREYRSRSGEGWEVSNDNWCYKHSQYAYSCTECLGIYESKPDLMSKLATLRAENERLNSVIEAAGKNVYRLRKRVEELEAQNVVDDWANPNQIRADERKKTAERIVDWINGLIENEVLTTDIDICHALRLEFFK